MEGLSTFQTIRFCLVGAFKVLGPKGKILTPRGRKACGLLSLLALSPALSRSRALLQDKLWSDRGEEQGSASLRQALCEIRRSFGEYKHCLIVDGRTVALDRNTLSIDLDDLDLVLPPGQSCAELPILLEDLNIRDREFEHWLRDQRAAFERKLEERARRTLATAAKDPTPSDAQSALAAPSPAAGLLVERPWVRVLPSTVSGNETGTFLSQVISDSVAQGIMEISGVDVCDVPRDTPGIDLKIDVHPLPKTTAVHLSLRSAHDRVHLWSYTHQVSDLRSLSFESADLRSVINKAIDVSVLQLRRISSPSDGDQAFALVFDAVQRMFRIDATELDSAEQLLTSAFERQPSGVFLACKAFLRAFYLAEDRGRDRRELEEEAAALVRAALEMEPYNAYVLALASYVHSFILRNYEAGHELAERSLNLAPSNPLALAFLGRVKSYLGQYEEGYKLTAAAREVVGPGPYRCTIDMLCSITAAVAGRHEEAIRLGEVVCALEPNFRPPLRYLLALYLKRGDRPRARRIFKRLKSLEPDFSMRLMREQFYPSTGLRQSGLLDFAEGEEFG